MMFDVVVVVLLHEIWCWYD